MVATLKSRHPCTNELQYDWPTLNQKLFKRRPDRHLEKILGNQTGMTRPGKGYIEELKEAIVRLYGCKAEYFATVPVTEIFQDKIVWQGDVEVFNLWWHPK